MRRVNLKITLLLLIVVTFYASCKKDSGDSSKKSNEEALYNLVITNDNYFSSMVRIQKAIAGVLLESKPGVISLTDYKTRLIAGKMPLSKDQQERILKIVNPLAKFGQYVAKANDFTRGGLASDISMGALNRLSYNTGTDDNHVIQQLHKTNITATALAKAKPDFTSISSFGEETDEPDPDNEIIEGDLTWGEVGMCALQAIGVDVAWAWSKSTVTKWTISAIRGLFTEVAERALGPVGVAIAAVDFGICLYMHKGDEVPNEDDLPLVPEVDIYYADVPLEFFNPNRLFFNSVKQSLIDYLINVKGVNEQDAYNTPEAIFQAGFSYNPAVDPASEYVGLYGDYVNEYFSDVYIGGSEND